MAVVLHAAGFPNEINGANLSKRFNRYVAKYKEARLIKCGSGQGLNEDELALGMTLEEKLNKICPHFDRMHALYGQRPNVRPPADAEYGRDEDAVGYHPVDTDSSDSDVGLQVYDDMQGDEEELDDWDMPSKPPSIPAVATPTVVIEELSDDGDDDDYIRKSAPFWADMAEMVADEVDAAYIAEEAAYAPTEPNESTAQTQPNESTAQTEPVQAAAEPEPVNSVAQQPATSKQKKNKAPTPVQQKKAQKCKENCPPNGPQGNTKPSVAQIYQERLNLKADYRKDLTLVRDKWKKEELADRREARADSSMENCIAHERRCKHELDMSAIEAEQVAKRAKAEHEYLLQKLKEERKTQLLIELFKTDKSKDQMKELIELVDYQGETV
ncbi:unnamed protein product [Calypogeia fissa]